MKIERKPAFAKVGSGGASRGLTQPAFAKRIGISASHPNHIKTNQRAPVIALAEKLGIDTTAISQNDP